MCLIGANNYETKFGFVMCLLELEAYKKAKGIPE